MEIQEWHPSNSFLKPYFNDLVEKYLDDFFIETVQTIKPVTEVEERAVVFLTKTVNTLSTINLLFKEGNVVPARILIRSLFEITLLTKKLILDGEIFLKY